MPFTATLYPTVVTGWANPYDATSLNGVEAFDRSGATTQPTANLVCSGFGLTGGGHAAINDLTVSITGRIEREGTITVYLARNGVPLGANKESFLGHQGDAANIAALIASGMPDLELAQIQVNTTLTFSGWGFPISDADLRNLQIVVFCQSLADGYCYIDVVSAYADYPAGDAAPDAFSFGADLAVPFSTVRTSAPITLTGLSATASVAVTNGEYEKNGSGTWTNADTTAIAGDIFKVRHTSASTGSTSKTTTLLIGGVSAGFTSTTEAADSVPTAFTLDPQTNVELSTSITSNEITVAGINVPSSISVSAGQYQINGGTWTSAVGSVTVGQKVKVRLTSSSLYGTLVSSILTIGGVTSTFNLTTKPSVGIPTAFAFTNVLGVPISTLETSNTITIAGLDAGVNVSVVNGELSKNGGAWTTGATTCVNGDTFAVRHTSAGAGTQSVITTLIVGNFAESFCSTTAGADILPAAFSFASQKDVGIGRVVTSATATITGINVATPVNVVGGQVSINGAAYARYGSITTGQTVAVRLDAIYQAGVAHTATVIVGGDQATFTATATSDYYTAL